MSLFLAFIIHCHFCVLSSTCPFLRSQQASTTQHPLNSSLGPWTPNGHHLTPTEHAMSNMQTTLATIWWPRGEHLGTIWVTYSGIQPISDQPNACRAYLCPAGSIWPFSDMIFAHWRNLISILIWLSIKKLQNPGALNFGKCKRKWSPSSLYSLN